MSSSVEKKCVICGEEIGGVVMVIDNEYWCLDCYYAYILPAEEYYKYDYSGDTVVDK